MSSRQERFDRLNDAIWSTFSVSGFPQAYREHINDLQRQATLVVMTTMDDIELLKEKAAAEDFNPDEQLENFCKSMYDVLGDGEKHSTVYVMKRIANGEKLDGEDMKQVDAIRESLAKSQMKKENVKGPHNKQWEG